MNDFMKWLFKALTSMIIWVFVLSIRWDGRPIFYHANDIFVQNALVRAVDAELAELWWRVTHKGEEAKEKTM